MAWLVLLKGDPDVLVQLAQIRDVPGFRVRVEPSGRYFVELGRDTARDNYEATARAKALLAIANRTVGLRSPSKGIRYAEISHTVEEELFGGARFVSVTFPPIHYQSGGSVRVMFGIDEEPVVQLEEEPSKLEKLIARFQDDELVTKVVDHLLTTSGRPVHLFKIYELIGNELRATQLDRDWIQGTDPSHSKWAGDGWAWWRDLEGDARYSNADMNRFRKSVHSEQGMGLEARHALEEEMQVRPMSADEGFDFMKDLVEKWLDWRSRHRSSAR
jgi:hypothetical protein